jgi:hypothetical protein
MFVKIIVKIGSLKWNTLENPSVQWVMVKMGIFCTNSYAPNGGKCEPAEAAAHIRLPQRG